MLISIIIPVYNEESIIVDTLKTAREFAQSLPQCEIIFVDDGSSDATYSKASEFTGNGIKMITYSQNMGKGYAVRSGVFAASGDIVFFTDCDLAYGLDIIKEGIELFRHNPDAGILIGSRILHPDGYAGYTFMRKFASKTFLLLLRLHGGLKVSDSQSGIKGFRREVVQPVFSRCEENRWSFDFEIILTAQKLGVPIIEIPVKIINHRESHISLLRDGIHMFRDIGRIKKSVKDKE